MKLVHGRGPRWPLLAFALAAFLAVGVGSAAAATLKVCPSGCAYTTIPAALAAAQSGDTIQVAAGTYAGGFTIDKKRQPGRGWGRQDDTQRRRPPQRCGGGLWGVRHD